MELQPRSSGFSVRFGVTHPPAIPDMYQVLVKKLDYRAEFVESGKNKSAKLGTLKRGELIEGLPWNARSVRSFFLKKVGVAIARVTGSQIALANRGIWLGRLGDITSSSAAGLPR